MGKRVFELLPDDIKNYILANSLWIGSYEDVDRVGNYTTKIIWRMWCNGSRLAHSILMCLLEVVRFYPFALKLKEKNMGIKNYVLANRLL
jgi:hypothetical protein